MQIKRSYSAKVFMHLFGAMLIITLTLSVFYLQLQKKFITERKIEEGRIFTSVLAGNARLGIFAGDKKQISEALRAAFGVKDVVGVCAYNANGRLLYREMEEDGSREGICSDADLSTDALNKRGGTQEVRFFENRMHIEFWAPIQSRNSQFSAESLYFDANESLSALEESYTVGFVGVILSKTRLQEAIKQILEEGLLVMLFFLGLVFIVTYFIIRAFTRPLGGILNSIKDYGIDVEAKDEVGFLADTFSSMIETLEKSITTTNTLKVDLENKVKALEEEITSRKKAETALRENENKFRNISEGIADGIAFVQDGKFTWLNRSFCDIFGYTDQDELLGRNAEELLRTVKPQTANRIMPDVMASESGQPYQTEVFRKDGSRIILDVKASRSTFDGRPATEFIVRNVTEKIELEKERKDMELKALSLSKLATIGEIATGIAHEINQPLTFVKIAYQVALRDLDNGQIKKEELKNKFAEALRQVERIALITEHLRNFGRKNIAMISQVSLPGVFNNALVLMSERIRLSNRELIKEIEKDLPEIYGNKMQLEQVFINIIQNSIDAMEGDQHGKIMVRMRQNGDRIEAIFCDTGPGIEPAVAEFIFDPFFTTKDAEKGIGLGLAISHNIIREHDGSIEYHRKEGWGATFVISLPISKKH